MEFASAPTVMRWVVAAAVAMVSLLPAAAAMPTPTATSTPAAAPCLRRLYFHPNEFERCRRGTTCFFFLPEEPFIRLDAAIDADHRGTDLDPRRLFPCLDYAKRGLSGIGFKLHEQLVPSETDLCALADPQDGCTFNKVMEALRNSTVDPSHPGYGMGLGASGALVSTEWRADKAVASAPYMEDDIILVRRKIARGSPMLQSINLGTLLQPSSDAGRILLRGVAGILLVVSFSALWLPTPVYRRGGMWLRLLQWMWNFVCILFGRELLRGKHDLSPAARWFLRGAVVVCASVVLAFYEVTVILNLNSAGLSSSVSRLSDEEMCRWTMSDGGAMEETFVGLVNSGRGSGTKASVDNRTWSTCSTVAECIGQVANGSEVKAPRCALASFRHTEMFLSWRTTILAAFRSNPSLCDKLEVVDADESGSVPRFNVGWQFADVNTSAPGVGPYLSDWVQRRQEINAQFNRARLRRDTQQIVAQGVGLGLPCKPTQHLLQPGLPLFSVMLFGLILTTTAAFAVPVLERALTAELAAERVAAQAAADGSLASEAAVDKATAVNGRPPPRPHGGVRRGRRGRP